MEEHNRGVSADSFMEMLHGRSHPVKVISTCFSEAMEAGVGVLASPSESTGHLSICAVEQQSVSLQGAKGGFGFNCTSQSGSEWT